MSCYHPLKAWKVGIYPSGKPKYKVTSYDKDSIEVFTYDDIKIRGKAKKIGYKTILTDYIEIPCGHCIGCRLARSREWAERCMLELKSFDQACFITLTYDDDNIPKNKNNIPELRKTDCQLFMKRLRDFYNYKKIKFIACGEYGTNTHRPHMHLILFGVDFSESREPFKNNFRGEVYYTSSILKALWPFGHHIITDVTFETCAYVSRYTTKKLGNKDNEIYDRLGIEKEFFLMSRRPGIGRDYYENNKDKIYAFDSITMSNGRSLKPPKYYDSLYDIDYPSDMERIKESRREYMKYKKDAKLKNTSQDYLSMLKSEEDKKLADISKLKRKEI